VAEGTYTHTEWSSSFLIIDNVHKQVVNAERLATSFGVIPDTGGKDIAGNGSGPWPGSFRIRPRRGRSGRGRARRAPLAKQRQPQPAHTSKAKQKRIMTSSKIALVLSLSLSLSQCTQYFDALRFKKDFLVSDRTAETNPSFFSRFSRPCCCCLFRRRPRRRSGFTALVGSVPCGARVCVCVSISQDG
jgi:hypothetical protein